MPTRLTTSAPEKVKEYTKKLVKMFITEYLDGFLKGYKKYMFVGAETNLKKRERVNNFLCKQVVCLRKVVKRFHETLNISG